MADYPYTTVTGKIKRLLEKIRTVGVPTKVTVAWLKTIGFTSSNDTTLIGVLKFVGFIDASAIPTTAWSAYRGAKYREVLGDAIRQGYADLFAIYEDANSRSNQELQHVFSTSSSAGAQVIKLTVLTFKALVDEADFSSSGAASEPHLKAKTPHTSAAAHAPARAEAASDPEVHIDIQIHISPESTAEQIDQIFKSMANHLYGRKGND
jgi:hypothetical protein